MEKAHPQPRALMTTTSDLGLEVDALRNETRFAIATLEEATDTMYVLFCAIIVFFMQCGFSMLEAGSVRERSVADILLKNIIDAGAGALAWFLVGFMFSSDGGNSFIGLPSLGKLNRASGNTSVVMPWEFIEASHGDDPAKYLLSYVYAATSATIVSGAIAERTQQAAYIVSSIVMTGLVYPMVAHWMWSDRGWLAFGGEGVVLGGAYDFAGGAVVHLTGGIVSLVAAWTVGPRKDRFDERTRRPIELRGHSTVLVVLGTFMLWVGCACSPLGSTWPSMHAPAALAAPVRFTLLPCDPPPACGLIRDGLQHRIDTALDRPRRRHPRGQHRRAHDAGWELWLARCARRRSLPPQAGPDGHARLEP